MINMAPDPLIRLLSRVGVCVRVCECSVLQGGPQLGTSSLVFFTKDLISVCVSPRCSAGPQEHANTIRRQQLEPRLVEPPRRGSVEPDVILIRVCLGHSVLCREYQINFSTFCQRSGCGTRC